MKNRLRKWLAVCISAAIVLTLPACSAKSAGEDTTAQESGTSAAGNQASGSEAPAEKIRLAVFFRNKDDKSFEQPVYEAAMRIKEEMADRFDVEIIETDPKDQSMIQPEMEEAAAEGADIVAAAGYQFTGPMEGAAAKYGDTKFILLDSSVPYVDGSNANVLSVNINANEAAFLAGAAAAYYTVGENAANTDKTIGFVGGESSDTVNNFLAGYAQGAHYVDPDMKLLSAYTASFTDTAKAKEVAEDQIREGADILFGAAGESGIGVMEAASMKDGVMAIGVDCDQYEMFAGHDLQPVILTSCLKELGTALYDICDSYSKDPGSVTFGKTVSYGLKDGCAGIVYNDNLTAGIGEDAVNKIKELERKILAGEITVAGGDGLTQEKLRAILFP